jgi:hypothetical protein
MKISHVILFCIIVLMAFTFFVPRAESYQLYSTNTGDQGSCATCHGAYLATIEYSSSSDETNWGQDLHDGHKGMMADDCDGCHDGVGTIDDQVNLGSSLDGISCVGCHGGDEDIGNDSISPGRGAGLRQHHFNSGVVVCIICHSDSDPLSYPPVGEDVQPPFYFIPDSLHPHKPTDSCNWNKTENVFGLSGLDNDGDGVYDTDDSDCPDCFTYDLDCDGDVDIVDIMLVASRWNTNLGDTNYDAQYDLDDDGDIDIVDVMKVAVQWGWKE